MRKSEVDPAQARTLLSKDARFEGTIVFDGAVRIDGEFEGKIITEDLLVVGEDAEVRGEMSVGRVIISGSVDAEIDAKRSVEIKGDGQIRGNVTTPHLIIRKGAAFGGCCQVSESQDLPAPPANSARG